MGEPLPWFQIFLIFLYAPKNMKQSMGAAFFNYLQVFANEYVKSSFDSC